MCASRLETCIAFTTTTNFDSLNKCVRSMPFNLNQSFSHLCSVNCSIVSQLLCSCSNRFTSSFAVSQFLLFLSHRLHCQLTNLFTFLLFLCVSFHYILLANGTRSQHLDFLHNEPTVPIFILQATHSDIVHSWPAKNGTKHLYQLSSI